MCSVVCSITISPLKLSFKLCLHFFLFVNFSRCLPFFIFTTKCLSCLIFLLFLLLLVSLLSTVIFNNAFLLLDFSLFSCPFVWFLSVETSFWDDYRIRSTSWALLIFSLWFLCFTEKEVLKSPAIIVDLFLMLCYLREEY